MHHDVCHQGLLDCCNHGYHVNHDVDCLYAEDDLVGLCRDFPDFDRELIQGMLADQGGDVPEVHACLRVSNGAHCHICCH